MALENLISQVLKKIIDCTKPIETEIYRNLIFADFGPSIAPAANHHPP
jgi:hypothetical protein